MDSVWRQRADQPACDDRCSRLAHQVLAAAEVVGFDIATAESCTGGYLASLLASVEGLSHRFRGGVVVYSRSTKTSLLGIPAADLDRAGAVSEIVVRKMARSIRQRTGADLTVAVSGNIGPPGEAHNGTVHIAVAGPAINYHQCCAFGDVDREEGRRKAAAVCLTLLLGVLSLSGAAAAP